PAMTADDTLTEKLALSVLAREGIAAIWQLHMAAADAHRTGHPAAAAAILDIAEAPRRRGCGPRDPGPSPFKPFNSRLALDSHKLWRRAMQMKLFYATGS